MRMLIKESEMELHNAISYIHFYIIYNRFYYKYIVMNHDLNYIWNYREQHTYIISIYLKLTLWDEPNVCYAMQMHNLQYKNIIMDTFLDENKILL